MSEPQRVHRPRTPGWAPPGDTVIVTRSSPYGNPWCVEKRLAVRPEPRAGAGQPIPGKWVYDVVNKDTGHFERTEETAHAAYDLAVRRYEEITLAYRLENHQIDLTPLAGKNLACWCPIDARCHADTLIEYANHPDPLRLSRDRRSGRWNHQKEISVGVV